MRALTFQTTTRRLSFSGTPRNACRFSACRLMQDAPSSCLKRAIRDASLSAPPIDEELLALSVLAAGGRARSFSAVPEEEGCCDGAAAPAAWLNALIDCTKFEATEGPGGCAEAPACV